MASKDKDGRSYGSGRTRNYASVFYLDSAPDNWRDILNDFHIPIFISPYHDNDLNPDGTVKKPHYHVLIMFDSVKTPEQAAEIFSSINCVGLEIVKSLRGYARYLCHLDNPEKFQYSISDVIQLGGSIYLDVIQSASDRYDALKEMMDFCDLYNVSSFYLLSTYSRRFRDDWFRILCDSGAVYMKEYLKSREWSLPRGYNHIVDKETGEIIL